MSATLRFIRQLLRGSKLLALVLALAMFYFGFRVGGNVAARQAAEDREELMATIRELFSLTDQLYELIQKREAEKQPFSAPIDRKDF